MAFTSDASLAGLDHPANREQSARVAGLYTAENVEYLYSIRQQQQSISPPKHAPLAGATAHDASSQATSSSLMSGRSEVAARGLAGTDREEWLRQIDELKRQLREKEELAKEYRNRSLPTTTLSAR